MKNNNIKIAIIEEGSFYNHLVDTQIHDLCDKLKYEKLSWVLNSFDNSESFVNQSKLNYEAIILNNYSTRNNNQGNSADRLIFNMLKSQHRDCMFISISGYREMIIKAEMFIDGEMCFYYLKQSNNISQNFEESCSVPAMDKLLTKLVTYVKKKSDVALVQKKGAQKLRISA